MDNFEKQIEILRQSPLFNLSLASKELFHSNFLAWVINNYKDESADILAPFIGEESGKVVISKVTREEKNRDLIIYFRVSNKDKRLIIENKVKSLPYLEQLERYAEGVVSGDYFVLLSIIKPAFIKDDKICLNNSEWRYLSYMDLSQLLIELDTKIKEENRYHKELLKDYIKFITSLSELYTRFEIDWESDFYDFSSIRDKNISLLHSIRMHDVYLKYKYYLISREVLKMLEKEFSGHQINFNKNWTETSINEVVINYGMLRSQGLFDVKYTIDKYKSGKPIVLGLQFQGEQFRLFVETEETGMAEKAANILYGKNLWFDYSLVINERVKEYPVEKDKTFNKYGSTFYYRSIKANDYKLRDIVFMIEKYIKFIAANRSTIVGELNK